jgi:hypothetical protein
MSTAFHPSHLKLVLVMQHPRMKTGSDSGCVLAARRRDVCTEALRAAYPVRTATSFLLRWSLATVKTSVMDVEIGAREIPPGNSYLFVY